MNIGNLKYRHLHWGILGQTEEDKDFAIMFHVIAENENEAVEICNSIRKCINYRTNEITECFTPHDTGNFVDAIKDIVNRIEKLEKEKKESL